VVTVMVVTIYFATPRTEALQERTADA